MIGQQIRDFEILNEIARGGQAIVYRARDRRVSREVAIKVILPEFAHQPSFIKTFEREAFLVAQLEHKDIVPLYEYWRDESGAYFVMRLMRGGTLADRLNKEGALSLDTLLPLLTQIANALQVAHAAGVVHRDLKPSNIMLDERGHAYLGDFGIAKILLPDEAQNGTSTLRGTFAYISPEQIKQEPVSAQTDIYALGVMLYELLAGVHPFHGLNVAELLFSHLREPLPWLGDNSPHLDPNLDYVIQRATAKDPKERYPDVLTLVEDLREVQVGKLAQAPAPVVAAMTDEPLPVLPLEQAEASTATLPPLTPTSREDRNRYAMLQNVRKYWIEGVLEDSLREAMLIDLGIEGDADAVANPWETTLRTGDDEADVNEPIIDVFDRLNGKLLILGEPGGGKTTTLLTLAADLLDRAERDPQHPLPVVLNLASWGDKCPPFAEWLVDELNTRFQVPRKFGTAWVTDDDMLLLLDGLDEVAPSVRADCIHAINAYRAEHGFVDVVVCSRIKDYQALNTQLNLNGAIVIQPLNLEQIVTYLVSLGPGAAMIYELIAQDAALRELAQSPLMLSIMVLAYHGKTASALPTRRDVESHRQYLFDVYVQRMIERQRSDLAYSPDETRHYLSWIASGMRAQAQTLFQIETLTPRYLPEDERRIYNRRVMIFSGLVGVLSYPIGTSLVAWGVGAAVWPFAVAGIFGGLLISDFYTRNQARSRWIALAISTTTASVIAYGVYLADVMLTIAVIAGLLSGIGNFLLMLHGLAIFRRLDVEDDTIPMLEQIVFSPSTITPQALFTGAVGGSGIMASGWLILSQTADVAFMERPITLLLSIGALALPTVLLSGFQLRSVDVRLRPNQGIQSTIHNLFRLWGLFVVVLTSLLTVAWIMLELPLIQALAVSIGLSGFYIGYFMFGALGGIGLYRHLVLRWELRQRGYLPDDLVNFLNRAVALILMRNVGSGYIFIHRYLLEYFADLSSRSDDPR